MEKESKETNKLTQFEYEQIKILNQKAFDLMQEFIFISDEMLTNTVKEVGIINKISKIYDFKKIIDAQSRICFEKIKIIMDTGKAEDIYTNAGIITIRHYYDDAYSFITKPVSQQIQILKKYTKKMIKLIQLPKLRKEFQRNRAKIRRKLDKLEKEQINIQNNLKNELD